MFAPDFALPQLNISYSIATQPFPVSTVWCAHARRKSSTHFPLTMRSLRQTQCTKVGVLKGTTILWQGRAGSQAEGAVCPKTTVCAGLLRVFQALRIYCPTPE